MGINKLLFQIAFGAIFTSFVLYYFWATSLLGEENKTQIVILSLIPGMLLMVGGFSWGSGRRWGKFLSIIGWVGIIITLPIFVL
jgi:hypothetical protein